MPALPASPSAGSFPIPPAANTSALKKNHGFVLDAGAQQSSLSYAVGSREVTLTPTGATTPVYVDGVLFNLPATTKAHTAVEGVHVFYLDTSGVPQVSIGFPALPWDQFSIYAIVYYSTSGAATKGLLQDERHTSPRDLAWHQQSHYATGTVWKSGLAIQAGTYSLNVDSNAAVTPGFDGGAILDEDLATTIGANAEGTYLLFRRTGTFWRWDSASFPFPNSGGYPAWDNAGVLTALVGTGNGQWMNVWAFTVPAVDGTEQWLFITGQAVYNSLAAAQAESVTALNANGLPLVEMVPRYQLTYHGRNTYAGTYKCRLEAVTPLVGTKASVTGPTTPTASGIPYTPTDTSTWGDAPRAAVSSALDSLASGANRRTTYSPPGSAPWALANGAGAASVAAGVLHLTLPAGTVGQLFGATATAPRASLAHGSSFDVDVAVRIAGTTALGGGADRGLHLIVSPADRAWCQGVRVTLSGEVQCGDVNTVNAWNNRLASTIVCPLDGTGCVRLRIKDGMVCTYVATAATLAAASWTLVRAVNHNAGFAGQDFAPLVSVDVALFSGGGQTVEVALDIAEVQVTDLREVAS